MATGLSDESEFMRRLWFGAEILSKVKVQKSTVVSQFRLCSRIDVITPNIELIRMVLTLFLPHILDSF